jgi:Tfp pilus assembly protein PilN
LDKLLEQQHRDAELESVARRQRETERQFQDLQRAQDAQRQREWTDRLLRDPVPSSRSCDRIFC